MSPEQRRLLDLLVVRGYLMAAELQLATALLIEELESDRRSRVFERWFERAVHYERVATLVAEGKMAFHEDAVIVSHAIPPVPL